MGKIDFVVASPGYSGLLKKKKKTCPLSLTRERRPQRDPRHTNVVFDFHRVHTWIFMHKLIIKLPLPQLPKFPSSHIPKYSHSHLSNSISYLPKFPSDLPNNSSSLSECLSQLCQRSGKLPNASPDISSPISSLPQYPPELPSSIAKLPNYPISKISSPPFYCIKLSTDSPLNKETKIPLISNLRKNSTKLLLRSSKAKQSCSSD